MSLLILNSGGTQTFERALPYSWDVQGDLNVALNYSWSIYQDLDKALAYSWNIDVFVDVALNYSWSIWQDLDKALAYSWRILGAISSARLMHQFDSGKRNKKFRRSPPIRSDFL